MQMGVEELLVRFSNSLFHCYKANELLLRYIYLYVLNSFISVSLFKNSVSISNPNAFDKGVNFLNNNTL